MKTGSFRCKAGFLGMLLGGYSSAAMAAAIGLSISPSVFTNNYVGTINLSIANLTPGMTVNVDIYADLDNNGVLDAGDLGVDGFQVTDGQLPLISGVRNLNVAGDDDGLTNGQILVQYNYPNAGGGLWSGKFLFRVSDPAGILASATQAVTVAQYPYPQAFVGRVTFAGTGLPLTNCPVGTANVGSGTDFTWTDTNGYYSIPFPPTTSVVAGFNQQGAIFNGIQEVSLSCDRNATNNLVITNGTLAITGQVTDSGTGAGVPHLQLDAHTPGGLEVVTDTDTNGDYTLLVSSNTWNLHPTTGAVAERGYVDQTRVNVVVTNANVPGENFTLTKPTALIYGTVKDTLGNPVIGVQVSTRDPGNNYHPVGRSFPPNGSYSIGVQPGTWDAVAPASADLVLQGLVAGAGTNVTLVAGQATNLNFVVTRTNFPSLTDPVHVSSSQFQFLLNGLAGQVYTIQTTTNLESANWPALLTTNAPCASVFILDSHATNGQRFYRALVVP